MKKRMNWAGLRNEWMKTVCVHQCKEERKRRRLLLRYEDGRGGRRGLRKIIQDTGQWKPVLHKVTA